MAFNSTLLDYYGTTLPSILPRSNYGPEAVSVVIVKLANTTIIFLCNLQPFLPNIPLKSPSQSIAFTNLTASGYIAPLDILQVEHEITFPEGTTLQVKLEYVINVVSPSSSPELASSFRMSDNVSAIIYPTTEK